MCVQLPAGLRPRRWKAVDIPVVARDGFVGERHDVTASGIRRALGRTAARLATGHSDQCRERERRSKKKQASLHVFLPLGRAYKSYLRLSARKVAQGLEDRAEGSRGAPERYDALVSRRGTVERP